MNKVRKTVLSGMRPTGPLHIGHLFGALKNWKRIQDEGWNCYYMVADWHALSTEYASPGNIRENIDEIAFDFLSGGLDPDRSTIFVQSHVPEHAQLHLMLSMSVPIPWLERNPVFKEQVQELKDKDIYNYGFLGYPVLQAADILIYKADAVPVGVDQVPHLELTREIARRFNFLYGNTFPEPEAFLTDTPKVPGTDNRKMSKSYNNCIYLKDSPESVREKIKNMFTDPTRIYRKDPGHPDTCPVFAYHRLFNEAEAAGIEQECKAAGIGCIDCKKNLGEKTVEFLAPIQEKRRALEADRAGVWKMLVQGGKKARAAAVASLQDAKTAMKMNY